MSLPSISQVDVESRLLACCWFDGDCWLVVLMRRGQCHPLHMSVPSNKIPQAENGIALNQPSGYMSKAGCLSVVGCWRSLVGCWRSLVGCVDA